MSRKDQRIKRAAKRKAKRAEELALLNQVDTLIRPLGCRAVDLGPPAVGVMGDARAYLRSVVVRVPPNATPEEIGVISTRITDRVRGVARVLMQIPTSPLKETQPLKEIAQQQDVLSLSDLTPVRDLQVVERNLQQGFVDHSFVDHGFVERGFFDRFGFFYRFDLWRGLGLDFWCGFGFDRLR